MADSPENKKKPFEFPYGGLIKAVMDGLYAGMTFAVQKRHVSLADAQKEFPPLPGNPDFIFKGDEVYQLKDRQSLLIANDIASAVAASDPVDNGLHSTVPLDKRDRLKFYRNYVETVQAILDNEPKLDENGKKLTVEKVFAAYGKHKRSELDCFDRQDFAPDKGKSGGAIGR